MALRKHVFNLGTTHGGGVICVSNCFISRPTDPIWQHGGQPYSVNPTSGMLSVASSISEMHAPMLLSLYTKHNQQLLHDFESYCILNNFFRWLVRDKCSGWTLWAPLLKQRPEISTSLPPRTTTASGWKPFLY